LVIYGFTSHLRIFHLYGHFTNNFKEAIRLLKNGKAPGIDQVHAEMLKAEEIIAPKLLTDTLQYIWQIETAPNDWNVGLIVKLRYPRRET
jgi:hypothetical protein